MNNLNTCFEEKIFMKLAIYRNVLGKKNIKDYELIGIVLELIYSNIITINEFLEISRDTIEYKTKNIKYLDELNEEIENIWIFYKIDLIKNELLFLGIKLLDIDKKALEKFITSGALLLSGFSFDMGILGDEISDKEYRDSIISDGFIFLFSLYGIISCLGKFGLEVSIKYNIITKFYIFFILIFFFFGFFLIVLRIIEIIKRMNYKGFLEILLGMINFLVLYGATENFMQKFIIQEIGM